MRRGTLYHDITAAFLFLTKYSIPSSERQKSARDVGTELPRYRFGLGRTAYSTFSLAHLPPLSSFHFLCPLALKSSICIIQHPLNDPSFDAALLRCMKDPYSHSHSSPSSVWLALVTSLHRCRDHNSHAYKLRHLVLPHPHRIQVGKHLTIGYRGPITNRRSRCLSHIGVICGSICPPPRIFLTYSQSASNRSVLGRRLSHVTSAEWVLTTIIHTFVPALSSRRQSIITC